MARIAALGLATALLFAPGAAAEPPPPWKVEVEAKVTYNVTRDTKRVDPDVEDKDRLQLTSNSTYKAKFYFAFSVALDGSLQGGSLFNQGSGSYEEATWHLEGTNGDKGAFACDPPVTAEPFKVDLGGRATGRQILWELALPDAEESNESMDCGADFQAHATHTTEIADSMRLVGADRMLFNQGNPTLPDIRKTVTEEEGDTRRTVLHEWKFKITHDCSGSDASNPADSEYVNQFDAGDAHGLPTRFGQRGGNACGPSAFTQLLNSYKRMGDRPSYLDPSDTYENTMQNPPADNANNNFHWGRGETTAESAGYIGATSFSGPECCSGFINGWLDAGTPVLVSTTYSSQPWGNEGGGHVILITGRTPDGDYIVSDPAGDYYSSESNHYGDDKCGQNVVYPKADVEAKTAGRSGLAIPFEAGADPRYLLITAHQAGGGPRAFRILLRDRRGRRAGFLPGNRPVSEIPASDPRIEPDLPSAPDAPAEPVRGEAWPFGVQVRDPTDGLVLQVIGDDDADGSPGGSGGRTSAEIDVWAVENGELSLDTTRRVSVADGQTARLRIDAVAPVSRIASPRNRSRPRRRKLRRFRGSAGDISGIRSVRYSLQDSRTGQYLNPRTGRAAGPDPVEATAALRHLRGGGQASWSARRPRRLRPGRYVLRVSAEDRTGNRQVVFRRGQNLARFTVRR